MGKAEGSEEGGSEEEMSPMLQQPFFQITLPLMVTFVASIWLASWMQNKRLDDIIARLGRIETKLDDHAERIVKLEAQASPITRGRG
jgi:cytochrome oxidase assembly protein ShyY1